MADPSENAIAGCHWRRDKLCIFRELERARGTVPESAGASARQAVPPLGRVDQAGDRCGRPHLRWQAALEGCRMLAAQPCPYAARKPSFDDRSLELQLGGKVLHKYRSRCKQTELLQALENACWPNYLEAPLGPASPVDPQHKLRDLMRSLNEACNGRLHFWSGHGGVGWKVVCEACAGS